MVIFGAVLFAVKEPVVFRKEPVVFRQKGSGLSGNGASFVHSVLALCRSRPKIRGGKISEGGVGVFFVQRELAQILSVVILRFIDLGRREGMSVGVIFSQREIAHTLRVLILCMVDLGRREGGGC